MSTRIIVKNFTMLTILVAIVALAAYTLDTHPTPVKAAADNRETIIVAPYTFGKTPPVLLGGVKSADAYVHLKLRFRADNTDGHPNVFQTAPANSGMRMEISGSTAAIIVPDLSVPDGLKGIILTSTLKTGQWYTLEIEALNGAYVRAKLNGQIVTDYVSTYLSMETSQLLVGGGFDSSRTFRGQLENISVTKGNLLVTKGNLPNSLSQWMLFFLCGLAFLMSLPRRDRNSEIAFESESIPITADLVDNIAIYGFSLALIAMGLLSIHLVGQQHLGLSKWIAHLTLPVSLVAILFAIKHQPNIWKWVKLPFGIIFLAYAAAIAHSIGYKAHAYDRFILGMFIFTPLAFSMSRSGLWLPKIQRGRMRFTPSVILGFSALMLALSWSTLISLTNWNAFRLSLDSNFGFVIVGSFLILRIIFAVLFAPENYAEFAVQNSYTRGKVRYGDSRLYLDVIAITIFGWISFRQDTLFIPGSEYHWEYFVGVVQGIKNGGWLLWDTPSQYGFLNILLASLVPSASAWQSFYIFQGSLLFLVSTGIYLATRRFTSTSVLHRLTVFALVFMALFFADPELIGPSPFPSSSVVRFFFVYALVLVTWFIPKFGLRQAIALSIVWSLAVIWSAESAIYGTSISLFILVALLQTHTSQNHRFTLAGKYVAIATLCLAMVLVIMFAYYFARLGVAPDLFGFFEHAIGYAGGFGYVTFPFSGPGNFLLLVFMGISILCIGAIRREGDANEIMVATLAAMAGCIWGISTYYIGRPVPQNITAMSPLIAMVVYLTLMLSKRMNEGAYTLPIKAAALPLFFIILIPLFNVKWIGNLAHIQSFTSDVTTKLPKASDELKQLLLLAKASSDTSIVYYGDDAAPPIFSGEYANLNERNWLPIPLQLLETPVSEARRIIYLNRYICRNKPNGGILVNRKGDAIAVRLQGFLHELSRYYDVNEIASGNTYTLYRFSKMDMHYCQPEVGKKIP